MSSYDLMNNHLTTRSIRRRYYAITFLVWFATALPLSLSVLPVSYTHLTLPTSDLV